MNEFTNLLESLGLTKSESKVYLALLKLGQSTKRDIVKEAEIPGSKLYEITDKLINKGIVSSVIKNKVTHFSAAPPEQILEYLREKREKILGQEKLFSQEIAKLKNLHVEESPQVEVFRGWKGMRVVFQIMLNELKKGEIDHVFGASEGESPEQVETFFRWFHTIRRKKKIIQKIIVKKQIKEWALKILNNHSLDKVRFSDFDSPTEFHAYNNTVLIVTLTKTPVVISMKSEVIAKSYIGHFNKIWKIADK